MESLRYIGDTLRNMSFAWPQLKRVYTFTTSTGVQNYQLPGDFYRMLDSSQWDTTNQFQVIGPVSDAFYASRSYAAVNVATQRIFHIVGPTGYLTAISPYVQRSAGTFQIDPVAPNSTDILAFGYLTCNWVQPIDWATATAYVIGDIRSVNGYIYYCIGNGTSGASRPNTGTLGTTIIDGSATWRVYTEPYPCSADNSKLTDNDFILFDDDVMIEGIYWRWKQLMGQDFQEAKMAWEDDLAMMSGRFKGVTRIDMSDSYDSMNEFPNLPLGGWSV